MDNHFKLIGGLFQIDENDKNMWSVAGKILSRWTWESTQTFAGLGYSHFRNLFGDVDRVDYLGGATYVTKENYTGKYAGGISLGNYININLDGEITGNFADFVINNPTYMHEYGHTFDSRRYGLSYLLAIGVPSIISADRSKSISGPPFSTHRGNWMEVRANQHAKKYFGKYYGVDWSNQRYHLPWTKDGEWRKDDKGFWYWYYYTIEDSYPTK